MKGRIDKNSFKTLRFPVIWGIMLLLIGSGYLQLKRSVPDTLYVDEEVESAYALLHQEPWIGTEESVEVSSGGAYTVTCKLWNVIPLKTVTVSQADTIEVSASGKHVGIYMETDGVLVIDTEEITAMTGETIGPSDHVLLPGDYITKIDGKELTGKEDLVQYMEQADGSNIRLDVIRSGYEESIEVTPVLAQDNHYKLGLWVRDDAQGIGTITYVKDDGGYGALGHGISDGDTGQLLGIKSGQLYTSEILSIQKGMYGTPGELQGMIKYGDVELLGTVEGNTECGIYGYIDKNRLEEMASGKYEIAFKQDIQIGMANVICTLGHETKEYEIEIEDIFWSPQTINKCFAIRVTDDELLEETGGIVQGLSGSPIIQDGKLVGAVTHVLVNDPTRGYGIFIENMLDAAR